ncbi:helix-turn-helix domain-containing protein [Ruminococcus sp.]|uniref:helix-turn-helix domain-containing protein n=1 Tax=Ruminococcus sp. TaxID=41978 RepID=UPI0025D3C320|nr:helix-turn-helix domain-containing protein [Ruminococcus sp.]MBR1430170.1 helix-turn-helix domain-containing protein [Ruminococcus sp.]
MSTVGFRIKLLRKALNLSQKEFAEKLYISQSYLSRIELDKESPSFALLRLISLEFDCSFIWLNENIGEMDIGNKSSFDYFNKRKSEQYKLEAMSNCSELIYFLSKDDKHSSAYDDISYIIQLVNYCTKIKNSNKASLVLHNLSNYCGYYFNTITELENEGLCDKDIENIINELILNLTESETQLDLKEIYQVQNK